MLPSRRRNNSRNNTNKDVSLNKFNILVEYDHKSKNPENFEKELSFLVNMFKNIPDASAARKKVIPLMHTVLEIMAKNEIE